MNHYHVQNDTIASGPHSLKSAHMRRTYRTGNPELLTEDALKAGAHYQEWRELGDAPMGYQPPQWEPEAERVAIYRKGTEQERLEAHRQKKRNALYQRRVQGEKAPFEHDGRRYDGSDDSIERFGVVAQQITWALMAGTDPATEILPGGWRDVEGVGGGPSTISEVQAMLQSHYHHGAACEANSQALKAQIAAATTREALDLVDLDAGWPE